MPDFLSIALKEWDLQITAMLAGEQAFLLRKGGILEATNEFEMEHARFLFFPTFIHQDPRMVKSRWRSGLSSVRVEPDLLEIRAYGEVAAIFEVPRSANGAGGRQALAQLDDLFVWDTPLLDMRIAYRPDKPLYLVVVRAFALPAPINIPNTLEYAGCKSWVPLEKPIDVSGSRPALSEERLEQIIARVVRAFATP